MDVEFQLIRNGATIFAHAFQVRGPEHFAEASSQALTAFRMQNPDVSLLHDIVMRWSAPTDRAFMPASGVNMNHGVTHAAIF